MTFTEAAAQVLRLVGKPLHYKEITDVAIEKNLLSHVGKSPEVTMGARLAALVKKADKENPLVRVKPGVFALRDWDGETVSRGLADRTPALERLAAAMAAAGEVLVDVEENSDAAAAIAVEIVGVGPSKATGDDEVLVANEDDRRRAELAAGAADLFSVEDDDDQPIFGGDEDVEPAEDEADAAGPRRRRRRKHGRGVGDNIRGGDDLPSYTISEPSTEHLKVADAEIRAREGRNDGAREGREGRNDGAREGRNDGAREGREGRNDGARDGREGRNDAAREGREGRNDAAREGREGRNDAARDGREGRNDAAREGREGRNDAARDGREGRNDAAREGREGRNDAARDSREGRNDAARDGREGRNDAARDSREGRSDPAREIRSEPNNGFERGRGQGPVDELVGRDLADALSVLLASYDRNAGPVGYARLAEAAKRRGRLGVDVAQGQVLLEAAARADNVRRQILGLRPRFRLGDRRIALSDWGLDTELLRFERDLYVAAERFREQSKRALLRRLQELPQRSFGELVLLLLERIGFSELAQVRRPGTHGAELHLSGKLLGPAGEIRTGIVMRRDGREIGRERVTELRGALHHYGSANAGWLITAGQVLSGAKEEANAPGAAPVNLLDGVALVRLMEEEGVGVTRVALSLPVADIELFDALKSGG